MDLMIIDEESHDPWSPELLEELSLRLPWETVCRAACHAMIERRSFDETLEMALSKYLDQEKKFARSSSGY